MTEQRHAPASLTFIGTATTLLRIGGFTLLTDPNFLHYGQRAHLGYGLWSRRRTEPAVGLADLPPLDAVLLSHLHGDHFDRVARAGLRDPDGPGGPAGRELPILTTEHAGRRLRRRGFPGAVGLPTWDSHELSRGDETIRVTAVPGRHGPGLVDRLMPPVMGSIVDWEQAGRRRMRLYVTGDTLYRPMLAEIPHRFGDIDAMLIHLGGTRVLGVLLTMDAAQGTALTRLVRPRLTVPIHYDDYPVFRSPLNHFLARVAEQEPHARVQPVVRGESITLPTAAVTV